LGDPRPLPLTWYSWPRPDHHRDQTFEGTVVDFEPIDAQAVLATLTDSRLPSGCGRALAIIRIRFCNNARRVELRGDLLQPAPTAPGIDTGRGDADASERGIGEREHAHS